MNNMKAVIVAAGIGNRLKPLTNNVPKCFLPIGEHRLIDYSLAALKECGIDQIAFVVGFMKEEFPRKLGNDYDYIYNPFYESTNDMTSLWFARDFVHGSDFVYLHSDVLYHPNILAMTRKSQAEIALAVEEAECDEETMKVSVEGLDFVESSKDIPIEAAFGEWTGIAKFSTIGWKKYLVEVEQLLAENQFNVYDTTAMNRLAKRERIIRIVPFKNLPFIEIDYIDDLKKARDEIEPLLSSIHSKDKI